MGTKKIGLLALLLILVLIGGVFIAQAQDHTGTTTTILKVRTAPGGSQIGQLPEGGQIVLEARNADSTWALVHTPDSSLRGWVSATYLNTDVFVSDLPVSAEVIGGTTTTTTTTTTETTTSNTTSTASGFTAICRTASNLRIEPSLTARVITTLPNRTSVILDGRSSDNQWVHVQAGDLEGWISVGLLRFGSGFRVTDLTVLAEGATATTTTENTSQGTSSIPIPISVGQRSIWDANSGPDNMTGTCNQPALAICAHLVAMTLNDDGSITWRGQEPQPYSLALQGSNFFSFEGRNKLNNGKISLALTFTGDSAWNMTMTQVFDSDPQCIRTFYYSATRKR